MPGLVRQSYRTRCSHCGNDCGNGYARFLTRLYGGTWRVAFRYCDPCANKIARQLRDLRHGH
jgi:hypothetical protein